MKKWKNYIVIGIAIAAVAALIMCQSYPHPDEYKIKDFPTVEQPDQITCGPTSATMVLKYYGKDVTVEKVKKATKTEWFKHEGQSVGMTAPEYIGPAMKQFGVPVKYKTGTLDEVKHHVSKNRPVIVLLRSGKTLWHYVVVIGYTKSKIIIADPGSGKIEEMPVVNFMGSWQFNTDMDGDPVDGKCGVCDGSGKWSRYVPKPLGRCPICDGSGKWDNVLDFLLGTVEAKRQTLIVPTISPGVW